MDEITLSPLGKTWILDLDGTVLRHNGHKTDEGDTFLDGALSFLHSIPPEDIVVFITSRKEDDRESTQHFLDQHNVHYHQIVYGAPYGERILINDRKPSGLTTAYAVNTDRNVFPPLHITIDPAL